MKTPCFQVTSPAPRIIWNELFQADAEALPDQSPAWLDGICATGKYIDASRLYEFTNGHQVVLPLVRHKGIPVALQVEESLAHNYGFGGWVTAHPISPEEVAAICMDLTRQPVLRISIRPNPRQGNVWSAAMPSTVFAAPDVAHVIDLSGGFEHVCANLFTRNTRNHIRKAERAGVVVECDTTGKLVPILYDLLQKSVDRWANQQHEPRLLARWRHQRSDPLHKLQQIARTQGQTCRTWVAWHAGKPAAACMVLQGRNVHDFRAAMDKEIASPVCANDLLLKLAIEDACAAGCHYYHMGCSYTATSSLAVYKKRFGAEPYPHAEYYIERMPVAKLHRHLKGIFKRLVSFRGGG